MVPRLWVGNGAPVIRPPIGELLDGVATALEETVVPDLAPATAARSQARAAIAILRRVAAVWDQVVPTVEADNRDIEETLRGLATALEATGALPKEGFDALEDAPPAGGAVPDFAHVSRRNEVLQRLLLDVQDALANTEKGGAAAELGALLERSVARERALARR